MAYNSNEPLFADQYRFEPIDSDWDRGRSGFTRLVSDLKNNERKGVIKRAEIASKHESGLLNETNALKTLKGRGVPIVYDDGKTNYETKNYIYLVIEYIDGSRVEKELSDLTNSERAEILTQFLGILAQAHSNGIVNGDVDLKHLFWRSDRQQLIVIDWGNAKLNVDRNRNAEFAYDLARTAEIIYSLVIGKTPPVTGSIILPDDSKLPKGLQPLPIEFRKLCQWAPRTPTKDLKSPYAAAELYKIAVRWKDAIRKNRSYKPKKRFRSNPVFLFLLMVGIASLSAGLLYAVSNSLFLTATPTSFTIAPSTSPPTITVTNISSPNPSETITPTIGIPLPPTQTTIPNVGTIPPPKIYSPILAFDRQNPIHSDLNNCWKNTTNEPAGLNPNEGFTPREDGFWRFGVDKDRGLESRLQTNFNQCPADGQIRAIGMNVWVPQIEQKREFGFFLENANGYRREYTIRIERVGTINQTDKMYLRVRDGNEVADYELLITSNLTSIDVFTHLYYQFSFVIFLEINNSGFDILYMNGRAKQTPLGKDAFDPSQPNRADNAVRQTIGEIESFGLVGYGGEIQTVIWPLVFFENK